MAGSDGTSFPEAACGPGRDRRPGRPTARVDEELGGGGTPVLAGAPAGYRLEWRVRWVGDDERGREMIRSVEFASADELRAFAPTRAGEAAGREFRIVAVAGGGDVGAVCVHAAQLADWRDDPLPRPIAPTRWEREEREEAERWRLYAVIAAAFAEMVGLRLAPRRGVRELLRSARMLLIGS